MFESDDWDLDQDFLNDADEKATQFYSQTDNEEIEPTKRRKVETYDDCNAKKEASGKNMSENKGGKSTRKNLILGMLNKSSLTQSDSRNVSKNFEKSISQLSPKICNNDASTLLRVCKKNLVLGILQKKNSQDNVIETNEKCVSNNIKNSNVERSSDKVAISNDAKHQLPDTGNKEKARATDRKNLKNNGVVNNNRSKPSVASNSRSNDKTSSVSSSRKELLCDMLKPCFADNGGLRNNCTKQNLALHKIAQVQGSKKMTLIRRFPGPAGLLPDDMDISAPISYLNSLEENENDRLKDTAESNLSEYCSQNTETLFTEGAWQLMLDDLPCGFLKGYEIATVKRMASSNYCQSRKIPFLAGMLEYIDHSHDNPPIVMRDFTDSIQGIVHRDIPLKYPGLLEPNVVVLLHDVGLLKTSGSLLANKYRILISPSSLLGIYCSKGNIVRTCYMESALRNCSSTSGTAEKKDSVKRVEKELLGTGPSRKIDKKCLNKTFESMNESVDFDANDFFFCISPSDMRNSENEKNFCNSTCKSMEDGNKLEQHSPKLSKNKENGGKSSEKEKREN